MNSKVSWSEQVESYVRGKAPYPRRQMFQAMKAMTEWDGRSDPPKVRHLEDELMGYSRLRVKDHRLVFREAFENGQREVKFLFAGPRSTVYEAFEQLLLDEIAKR